MDGERRRERLDWNGLRLAGAEARAGSLRWKAHAAHGAAGGAIASPHRVVRPWQARSVGVSCDGIGFGERRSGELDVVRLDGSRGEGGGQILRTALTLSLLTGRPFRIQKIRANREKPGLRPQHKTAVEAAAELGHARVVGAAVGSRELSFSPAEYEPRDLTLDIGTAGSTGLVLQTLHLPLALRTAGGVRVVLTGGTFNPKAPAYTFLEATWRGYLWAFGMPTSLAMPAAGFYPRGGGRLEAWIEPASPRPWVQTDRGPLRRIRGVAGVANLRDDIAERMRDRAIARLEESGLAAGAEIEIELARWSSPGQGAALSLIAEHDGADPRHVRRPGRARQAVGGRRRRGRRPAPRLRGRPGAPPSTPTPPTRSSCPWPSRRAAASSPSARSPSTSAPTSTPSPRSSTAPSPSRSPRRGPPGRVVIE